MTCIVVRVDKNGQEEAPASHPQTLKSSDRVSKILCTYGIRMLRECIDGD